MTSTRPGGVGRSAESICRVMGITMRQRHIVTVPSAFSRLAVRLSPAAIGEKAVDLGSSQDVTVCYER